MTFLLKKAYFSNQQKYKFLTILPRSIHMNLKKLAMIAIAGTMAFGLAACTEDSGTNGSIDNGNHGSLRDRDGDDNTPSTVGPNGYDYKDSRSYRDYTADLTVGSVKHSVVRIGDQLWMGENLNDPSGRAVKGVHENAY